MYKIIQARTYLEVVQYLNDNKIKPQNILKFDLINERWTLIYYAEG